MNKYLFLIECRCGFAKPFGTDTEICDDGRLKHGPIDGAILDEYFTPHAKHGCGIRLVTDGES